MVNPNTQNRPFSRPSFVTTSINIEGLSAEKESLLADMCKEHKCDILVIQETHRGRNDRRPKVSGMKLVAERPHEQYGSAIFTHPDLVVKSTHTTDFNNIEILTIEMKSCTVTSVYKPPNEEFNFTKPKNFDAKKFKVVLGDFNCHSIAWGYEQTDRNGEDLEGWVEQENLKLIHDPKLQPSFNSGRWRRGYNPDNIFVSEEISGQVEKKVGKPIPRTQHRPIMCEVGPVINSEFVPFKRRFNFKRADWHGFSNALDLEVNKIDAEPKNYDIFVDLTKRIARQFTPRGCRTQYISGMTRDAIEVLEDYQTKYEQDPFADDTIEAGENLMRKISYGRKQKWMDLLRDLDMKQNSRRAWRLVKNLSGDPKRPNVQTQVTPNQIAHQLILNGKTTKRRSTNVSRPQTNENEISSLATPFSEEELDNAIKKLKEKKAAGPDDMRPEIIKRFGPVTKQWLVKMMNFCKQHNQFPKQWRKAHVVALLKPGKEPDSPKNFRPISLLCQLYKVFERMILERIAANIDKKLIPEQAGFRPGKNCCSQVLNLIQHIEDGYEKKKITGAVFIDLTAAYDTVNHKLLLDKIYRLTKDLQLMKTVQAMLQNRRFFVTLHGKKSRWRNQKNGLPQGSVLSPLLYNIYVNDQPTHPDLKRFIYADDTALCAQGKTFEEVEEKLQEALELLSEYYLDNHLNPNPSKTQVSSFHLRNKEAGRQLNVTWKGIQLEHCSDPKYLGIRLDRTLSFKKHCQELKGKVSARNNILRKLTGSTWGAQPEVLRSTAMALCFAAGEYAAPAWESSAHTKQVDVALNETIRIITGCLRPTPVNKMYPIAGIAPPNIRRQVAGEKERKKQLTDERHPMFNHVNTATRLKSRHSFVQRTTPLNTKPETRRLSLWKASVPGNPDIKEEMTKGKHLPFDVWKTLNRLRVGVSRCKSNQMKWGYKDDDNCDCGEPQNEEHLKNCSLMEDVCSNEDLILVNDKAIRAAYFWRGKI